jgi:hypothetical protein
VGLIIRPGASIRGAATAAAVVAPKSLFLAASAGTNADRYVRTSSYTAINTASIHVAATRRRSRSSVSDPKDKEDEEAEHDDDDEDVDDAPSFLRLVCGRRGRGAGGGACIQKARARTASVASHPRTRTSRTTTAYAAGHHVSRHDTHAHCGGVPCCMGPRNAAAGRARRCASWPSPCSSSSSSSWSWSPRAVRGIGQLFSAISACVRPPWSVSHRR